jgi:D-tyrosyl-tRNA(Tyr) deacylase
MRVLVQRVSRASVEVDGNETGAIGEGLLAFVGIRADDTSREVAWMAEKVANLRIFEDENSKMNLSLQDIRGSLLVVSQFTLYGELPKGNRPNFMTAARPEKAEILYNEFLALMRECLDAGRVQAGVFHARMQVELVNEGPVTIMLERNPAISLE